MNQDNDLVAATPIHISSNDEDDVPKDTGTVIVHSDATPVHHGEDKRQQSMTQDELLLEYKRLEQELLRLKENQHASPTTKRKPDR